MTKIALLFFFSLFFCFGCKEASFKSSEGLNAYTFDKTNSTDSSFSFFLQAELSDSGEILTELSLNNGSLFKFEAPTEIVAEATEEEEEFEFRFQNSVLAYKKTEEGLEVYQSPYLSKTANLNVVTTVLYNKIKNSLSFEDFTNLEVSYKMWSEILNDYENACIDCLIKDIDFNYKKINEDIKLLNRIKSKLNIESKWIERPIEEWRWVILKTEPMVYSNRKITLVEGEEYEFNAELWHPSKHKEVILPQEWKQDFLAFGSVESLTEEKMNIAVGYDQDLDLEYSLGFKASSEGVDRDFIYNYKANFDNTNRAAQTKNSLPQIDLAAGQELRINLIQYFEDLDNPKEDLSLKIINENEVFKKIGNKNLLIYGPATPYFIGDHIVEFLVEDSEGLLSQIYQLNIKIRPNTPPVISYAYFKNNPTVRYYDGDTIDFIEGELDQYLTIVSTDIDGDRTVIETKDAETIRSNFSYDTSRAFGMIEPRNGSWKFDYMKPGFFDYSPGSNTSETKFLIRPSYYQVMGGNNTYNIEFKVLSSSSYSFNGTNYEYSDISLEDAQKALFDINVRIINYDDPPVYPGSNINAAPATENQGYTLDLISLINPIDSSLNSTDVTLIPETKSCEWMTFSNNTISGMPPLDSPEACTYTFNIKDSALSLHGSERANSDLRTPTFTVTVPIINVNYAPAVVGADIVDLGVYDESEAQIFTLPLLDVRPGNGVVEGNFTDRDYDLTDPENPFVDPIEEFEFICEVKAKSETTYGDCSEAGLMFNTNGIEQAVVRPDFKLVYGLASQDFDIKIRFKDRQSTGWLDKNFTLRVVNKPAPLRVNFTNVFKNVNEGETFQLDLRVERFSDDPVDIYPFKVAMNCFGCIELYKSDINYRFTSAQHAMQSVFIIENILETNYDHGDGDGNLINYILFARAESLRESYDEGSPVISPVVESSGQMALEVRHKNLPPSSIRIGTNSSTTKFVINADKQITGDKIVSLKVDVLDPDEQDLVFESAVEGLSGNAVQFNGSEIVINYSVCPIGGRTLTKTFTLRGFDPSGLTVTRQVEFNLKNVDTFAGSCK